MPPAKRSSSSEVIASPLTVAKSVVAVSFGQARHDDCAERTFCLLRPDLFVSQITQSWRGLGLVLPGVDPDHGLTVGVAGRCLKWVNRVDLAMSELLPLFPR